MKRLIVALASAVALVVSGSAAVALSPSRGPAGPPAVETPVPPAASAAPTSAADPTAGVPSEVGAILDRVLSPLGLGSQPDPESPSSGSVPPLGVGDGDLVARAAAKASADAFPGLAADAYAGYGTGTAYTSDAELSGVGVDVEKAFSGAVYGSAPLAARINEHDRSVAPALKAAHGYGRGSAAEIGRGEDREEIDDDSDAQAPPTGDVVSKELADINLVPILHADLLQSKASARSATNGCVVGSDLALGQGLTARSDVPGEEKDAERPILSVSDDDPPRAVSQSLSHTGLVAPDSDKTARFGLFSETRQTIAPVTLFKGTDQELTIELGGEWVLRVVADGTKGSVSYGPHVEDPDPDTPVVRIDRKKGDDAVITIQDIADGDGIDLSTPGVEEFIIGEDPRAVGGGDDTKPVATGTKTAAAVDVLRVRIPDETQPDGVLDVRVGHMEAAVAVPAGGISCPGIAMAKQSDPGEVRPGESFEWIITVGNPNDCLLDKVKVVDTVTAPPGVRYRILGASPKPSTSDSKLTFTGFKPLRMGESFTARIAVEIEEGSGVGSFTNEAVATGLCGPARVGGESETGTGVGAPVPVPREGAVVLQAPVVAAAAAARVPALESRPAPVLVAGETVVRPRAEPGSAALPRTGGWEGFLSGLSLLAGAGLVRRLKRRI